MPTLCGRRPPHPPACMLHSRFPIPEFVTLLVRLRNEGHTDARSQSLPNSERMRFRPHLVESGPKMAESGLSKSAKVLPKLVHTWP